jgi:hypothetical protein
MDLLPIYRPLVDEPLKLIFPKNKLYLNRHYATLGEKHKNENYGTVTRGQQVHV